MNQNDVVEIGLEKNEIVGPIPNLEEEKKSVEQIEKVEESKEEVVDAIPAPDEQPETQVI